MRHHNNHGFTLIEVLVALIILAIVALAVMKAMRDSIADTEHVQQTLIAENVANNILGEMQIGLKGQPTTDSSTSGSTIMMGRTWDWQARIAEADSPFYQRIAIDVFSQNKKLAHIEGFAIKGKPRD